MHEAEKYLKENPGHLYVSYQGKKRRLFISHRGIICMIGKRRRNAGYPFSDWEGITKVYYPAGESDIQRKLVEKYRQEASKATFTNQFIRDCLGADAGKSLYENHITTGNGIDGKIISLASIAKTNPYAVDCFVEAMQNRSPYRSLRFPFRGYECSLGVTVNKQGEPVGHFAMEFKNCGNGYYYMLINDKNFIGYDVD